MRKARAGDQLEEKSRQNAVPAPPLDCAILTRSTSCAGTPLNARGDTPQHPSRNGNVPGVSPLGVSPGTATGAPGSRRGPLGYARDLAPARCRFRSTQVLPFSGTLLQPHYRQPPGVSPRLVDPPASPRGLGPPVAGTLAMGRTMGGAAEEGGAAPRGRFPDRPA